MAGSIIDSFLGQSEIPEAPQIATLGQAMRRLAGKADMIAAPNVNFNRELLPALMDIQLGVEKQYDPGIAALREATTKAYADQLALGGQLPSDVLQSILQAGFERNNLTGLGSSGAGRNLVARDIGKSTLELLMDRINGAGNWVRGSPLPDQLSHPINDITPGVALGYDTARENAMNAYRNYVSQIRSQNTANLVKTPIMLGSQAAGTVLGAMFGTQGMGSGLGGGSGSPSVSPGSFGGAGQPSFSTLQFAAPQGTSYYGVPLRNYYGG